MNTYPTPIPKSIGRYEVLGHLATGGMAEIFLARLSGPGAFERPIVLKRILPHLARNPSFVSMFLDEARIVSGIRHPQVVQVQELTYHDQDLFLVMEYIEGESLGGIMRRLSTRSETLSYTLGAYIIAEACAGLHAAHELTDTSGISQHVVHRDISPQNIMVSYAGEVKVLDFGIAKSVDRSTHTMGDQLKGKLEYMSPEQCQNLPLDRRSDIFALGIVLYELTVGRRLFKRESPYLTFQAICNERVPRPSELVLGYPELVEKICMRALSRLPEDRYSSALEMRRDLVAALRVLNSGELEDVTLSRLMQDLFADRIEEKREMLHNVTSGSQITQIPPAETDQGVCIPDVTIAMSPMEPPDETVRIIIPDSTKKFSPPVKRKQISKPKYKLILGTGAGAVVCAILLLVIRPTSQPPPANSPASPTESSKVEAATPLPPTPVEPADPVTVTRNTVEPAAISSEPAPELQLVTLQIDSIPKNAKIIIDGKLQGLTPKKLQIRRSEKPIVVKFYHRRYQLATREIFPLANDQVFVRLSPKPKAKAKTKLRAKPKAKQPAKAPSSLKTDEFIRFPPPSTKTLKD